MKTPSPELVSCIQVCMWLQPVFLVPEFSKFEKSNVKFLEKKKELVRSIGSFEKSTIRKIGGKITVFDCKSKGNDFWFEESGVSNNRVFVKTGIPLYFYFLPN